MSFLFASNQSVSTVAPPPAPMTAAAPPPASSTVSGDWVKVSDGKDQKEKSALLRTTPSFGTVKRLLGPSRTGSHAKFGKLDVYDVVLTIVSGATSDASGNLPGYFNVGGQLVNTGAWSTMVTAFDIVRVKRVVYTFLPKLGWKTARSFTPLTATACQMVRVANDPEGALSSPTVANMLARSPSNKMWPVKDYSLVDPFVFVWTCPKPIVRFSATALTQLSMHDWLDVGDVNSYAVNGQLVGGIVWNVLQAGACPASTDIFSVKIEYVCEFALRNG